MGARNARNADAQEAVEVVANENVCNAAEDVSFEKEVRKFIDGVNQNNKLDESPGSRVSIEVQEKLSRAFGLMFGKRKLNVESKEERLRSDLEKTDKMLEERGLMLEKMTKEIDKKVETQKALQTEADMLFRFRLLCKRIRPLRETEQQNMKKEESGDEMEEKFSGLKTTYLQMRKSMG
ncbi:unnamed protein product [Lactuca saligna]|uniref:Uncharacterized protein n=1 Tax=Lactuca saligna TaxID=75948 RepID=A0AA35ZU20_LACSI|nr:unnamed protein product [Lactuca saligna]